MKFKLIPLIAVSILVLAMIAPANAEYRSNRITGHYDDHPWGGEALNPSNTIAYRHVIPELIGTPASFVYAISIIFTPPKVDQNDNGDNNDTGLDNFGNNGNLGNTQRGN
jgi:hypothetical protein